MAQTYPVYVVDDDPTMRDWVEILCEEKNLDCRGFADGAGLLEAVGTLASGCILLDMRMPGRTGLQVQQELGSRGVTMPVVAITGYGDVDMAVQSMRLGALDFLEKPFPSEVLFEALERAFKRLEETQAS